MVLDRESSGRVLLLVRDAGARDRIAGWLSRSRPDEVVAVDGVDAALDRLDAPDDPGFDLILAELDRDRAPVLAVLERARLREPAAAFVGLAREATFACAVDAFRGGATDLVAAPPGREELLAAIERAMAARPDPGEPEPFGPAPGSKLVARSEAMRGVLETVRRAAPLQSTVLLTGETGTGKELLAASIHELSPRARGPFVKVNCAALPETLLESELFGHERGAFTGADRLRLGRFELASRGTLFLDEIGELGIATQAKLLRVLEEREFRRLGGVETLHTTARVVAATNADLDQALRSGRFRKDLYFRLNVIGIHVPPLRERPEDAVELARRFARELAAEIGRPERELGPTAIASIRAHEWKGNVRELRNAIERAVLTGDRRILEAVDLAATLGSHGSPAEASWPGSARLPAEGLSLAGVERELVLRALEQTDYVQKEAAKLLHVSRRKLNYMVRRLGLTHPSWRRNRGPAPGVEAADERGSSRAPSEGGAGTRDGAKSPQDSDLGAQEAETGL